MPRLGRCPFVLAGLQNRSFSNFRSLAPRCAGPGYIPIDRKDTRKALIGLKRAAEQIRQGTSVFIFPEGTRSADGVIGDFKKGWFVLAAKSQQPVVPVSISGSYNILPKKCWTLHPGEIRFSVGAPIQTAGCESSDRDLLMEQIREAIRANLTVEEGGGGGRVEPEIREADLHDGGNIRRDA